MAIFSAFVKSPPVSPSPRSVPNGGLGGFVQLKGKAKNTFKTDGGKSEAEKTATGVATRTRKEPPPPIRVDSIDLDAATAQSAPLHQNDNRTSPAALWKISHPPLRTTTGVSFMVTEEDDPPNLISRILWKSNDGSKMDQKNDIGRTSGSAADIATRNIPSPVELPGSLLLPDQGYSPGFKPVLPNNTSTRPRSYSDHPLSSLSNRRSRSFVAPTKDMDMVKAVFRGEKTVKQSRSATHSGASTAVNTPMHNHPPSSELLMRANIDTLSAEDLILAMPMMKAKNLATDWLPAMEKEIGKYKGILHMYSSRTEVHGRHISSICQDLMNLLMAMKKSAGSACKQFEKAQADIDIQKRTDLEKLQRSEEQLQEALLACGSKHDQVNTRAQEYQHLKHVLYHVVATLGGCIRNNLAYKLYHSPEGLSEEVVRILQAYKQWDDHTLKTFPSLVPAELYEDARQRADELQKQLTEYQQFIDKQQNAVLHTPAGSNDLTSQLESHQDDTLTQIDRTRSLERENAALREHVFALKMQIAHDSNKSAVEDDLNNETDEDLVTVFSHHSDELEERDSFIVEQNAVIEDLLKQIHIMSGKHRSNGNHVHDLDHVPFTTVESDRDEVESTASGSEESKLSSSRRLSKALDPYSRGMSGLPSSFEDDLSTTSSQIPSENQRTEPYHRRLSAFYERVHNDDALAEQNTSGSKTHTNDEEVDTIPPHSRKPNMDVEITKHRGANTRQRMDSIQPITDNSSFISRTEQANTVKSFGTALDHCNRAQPYMTRRSSRRFSESAYPNIASQLHSAPPTNSHTPGPIRHGKAMIQGLRNEQLPLRLLLDTITMQERDEQRSLSLISERTESPVSIKPVVSPRIEQSKVEGRRMTPAIAA